MPNSTLAQMGFLDEDTQQETVYDIEDTQARSDISTINSKIPSNASSSNKLATKSDVSAAYIPGGNAELATLPPLTSENLNRVFNMIYDFITNSDFVEGAGKSVKAGNEVGIVNVGTSASPVIKYTVFGGFFDTSSLQPKDLENPVEVAGIERDTVEDALFALSTDKEDTILTASPLVKEYDEVMRQYILRLNQDDTPTDNSNNPVKSSGIKSALDATVDLLKDTTGWTGKNRLRNNRNAVTTENALVYTKNSNDSVTIGTQTASSDSFYRFYIGDLNLPNGVYTVTKGVDDENIRLGVDKRDANENYIGRYGTATYGKSLTFEYNDAGTYHPEPWIEIENGKALSAEVTVFPMLTTPEEYALSPTYEPYHESVAEMLKYHNVRLQDVPNEGTVYDKVVNVAEQIDALVTDIGVKFSGYVLWTQSMFLRVEAIRCNATTLLYTIFNVSYTIYNGAVQNGAVTVYKFEGTQMTS